MNFDISWHQEAEELIQHQLSEFQRDSLIMFVNHFEFLLKAIKEKERLNSYKIKPISKIATLDQIIEKQRRKLRRTHQKNFEQFSHISNYKQGFQVLLLLKKKLQISDTLIPIKENDNLIKKQDQLLKQAQFLTRNNDSLQKYSTEIDQLLCKQENYFRQTKSEKSESLYYLQLTELIKKEENQLQKRSTHQQTQSHPQFDVLPEIQNKNENTSSTQKRIKTLTDNLFRKKFANSNVKKDLEKKKFIFEYKNQKETQLRDQMLRRLQRLDSQTDEQSKISTHFTEPPNQLQSFQIWNQKLIEQCNTHYKQIKSNTLRESLHSCTQGFELGLSQALKSHQKIHI